MIPGAFLSHTHIFSPIRRLVSGNLFPRHNLLNIKLFPRRPQRIHYRVAVYVKSPLRHLLQGKLPFFFPAISAQQRLHRTDHNLCRVAQVPLLQPGPHMLHPYLPQARPQERRRRANPRALCDMVYRDAKQHAASYRAQTERDNEVLIRLAQTLALEVVPEHIEAFDISNLGNEHITAGMVVLKNGRFSKKDYRTYKIKSQSEQNDYGAMREAIDRRLQHAEEAPLPDLFLLDGGKGHVSVIRALLAERAISIPVFGMVKDEYHKTRALTDEEREISIAKDQGIFTMLYRLQEEVHRYTISRMTNAKRKTLRTSSLEEIPGIGAAKARALLQKFHTISAIKNATAQQLRAVPGISPAIAQEIISYFQKQKSTSPSTKKGETNP